MLPARSPSSATPSIVSVAVPDALEAALPSEADQAEEPQPVRESAEPPQESAPGSDASAPPESPSIGPLVEPKLPANYQAVLAAGAPRTVAAR